MVQTGLTTRARQLRAEQTDVERLLWSKLRNRQLGGWKWRRQAPRDRFILDFLCVELGLVIELDGGQHAEREAQDAARTAILAGDGLRVLRFWNPDVVENLDGVCETILAACEAQAKASNPLLDDK